MCPTLSSLAGSHLRRRGDPACGEGKHGYCGARTTATSARVHSNRSRRLSDAPLHVDCSPAPAHLIIEISVCSGEVGRVLHVRGDTGAARGGTTDRAGRAHPRGARAQGAYTLAVTSAQSSTLAASADEPALCHSGPERSVAATKTYTTQLAVLCLLSALLSSDAALLGALEAVPEAMVRVLEGAAGIAERAERYRHMGACAVLGRGLN